MGASQRGHRAGGASRGVGGGRADGDGPQVGPTPAPGLGHGERCPPRRSPPRGPVGPLQVLGGGERRSEARKSPWQEIKGSEAGRGGGAGRSATKERGGEGKEGAVGGTAGAGPLPSAGHRCAPGRAGPPAAAAGTAPRESARRRAREGAAAPPTRKETSPSRPPRVLPSPSRAEPQGLGAGSASLAPGQRLPPTERKGELCSLGGGEGGKYKSCFVLSQTHRIFFSPVKLCAGL